MNLIAGPPPSGGKGFCVHDKERKWSGRLSKPPSHEAPATVGCLPARIRGARGSRGNYRDRQGEGGGDEDEGEEDAGERRASMPACNVLLAQVATVRGQSRKACARPPNGVAI